MVCLSTVCPGVRGVYLCVVRPGVMCPGVHGVCLSAACPGGRTDACRTAMAGAKEKDTREWHGMLAMFTLHAFLPSFSIDVIPSLPRAACLQRKPNGLWRAEAMPWATLWPWILRAQQT
eukprot:scaffold116299_cov20-Tisochrysis_lutea.AAC.2